MGNSHKTRHAVANPVFAVLFAVIASVVIGTTYSCYLPGLPLSANESATPTPTVDEARDRSLVPGINMTPASYVVSGSGPGGLTFSRSTLLLNAAITGLRTGQWSVTVSAKNSSGALIGQGSGTVAVTTGTQSRLAVTVTPFKGNGTLNLGVSWIPADVQIPSIDAQLYPVAGTMIPLAFTLGQGTATLQNLIIPAGYYSLCLKLRDNGVLVMGAVEVVRILKDQTTTGAFVFSQVNKPAGGIAGSSSTPTLGETSAGTPQARSGTPQGQSAAGSADPARAIVGKGSIAVSIIPQMNDPVPVTITGQTSEIGTGTPMTVSATVPPGLVNPIFIWCLNGVPLSIGPGYTFNTAANPLGAGIYTLDVLAYAPDGSRGGSASCSLRVRNLSQVTLEWDPNKEPTLAGYKMYVGTTSGVYGTPLDAGRATTFSVGNLLSGRTYYFAVTAYSTSGFESGRSNELAYAVP